MTTRQRWEYMRARKDEQKEYTIFLKEISGCEICGKRKSKEELTFHHIDKSKKKYQISSIYVYMMGWEILLKELKKCMIACVDCHKDIHKNHNHLS